MFETQIRMAFLTLALVSSGTLTACDEEYELDEELIELDEEGEELMLEAPGGPAPQTHSSTHFPQNCYLVDLGALGATNVEVNVRTWWTFPGTSQPPDTLEVRDLDTNEWVFNGAAPQGPLCILGTSEANTIEFSVGVDNHGYVDAGAGADTIEAVDLTWGFPGSIHVWGGDGNDTISGYYSDDELHGEAGDDSIFGGEGADFIDGGTGDDWLGGDDGDDEIWGKGGSDSIFGDAGDDAIYGNHGDDALYGGGGDDLLHGGVDADDLDGGAGADRLIGDGIHFTGYPDTIVGGTEDDTAYIRSSDGDTTSEVETIIEV